MMLKKYLVNHITQHGPIDVGQFMNIALCHPEYGYYMKQDPFGAGGDFTTAPEISQMFGELIGAWVADLWLQMGKPTPFGLVECGPGRGTLMADIMRATGGVEGFHKACLIHLIEISPALKKLQAKALELYNPTWHQSMGAVSTAYPLIILGNEFMDALPFRQLVNIDGGWAERVVTRDLSFGLRPAGAELISYIPQKVQATAKDGDVFEISPVRSAVMETICDTLKRASGAALLIDYGHTKAGTGDTFQALHKHEYVSVLDCIGDADLTSHVDFEALEQIAQKSDADLLPIVEQGTFLMSLGLGQRAQYLAGQSSDDLAENIKSALHRLSAPDQMGSLFKVMGLSYGHGLKPAGFNQQ